MIGENYPEKELLKNGLELTLCGCRAPVFGPFLIARLPEEGEIGSVRGITWDPKRGALLIFFLFRMASILGAAGADRMIILVVVCPDYLLGLCLYPLASEDLGRLRAGPPCTVVHQVAETA